MREAMQFDGDLPGEVGMLVAKLDGTGIDADLGALMVDELAGIRLFLGRMATVDGTVLSDGSMGSGSAP